MNVDKAGRAMTDWKDNGVRVIPGDSLDPNTAQTPGMNRAAAVNKARAGAEKIWAGTVTHPRQRQDGRPPSWRPREHHLRGEGQGADALGR
jgi:uncharacterized RmlC-like cupin family protein